MSGLGNNKKGQPIKKGAESNDKPNSKEEAELDTLIINVFFDGTGNNMHNTELRLETEPTTDEAKLQNKLKDETSFGNYYSNVALLYMAGKETDSMKYIYIDGAGTFKHKTDSVIAGLAQARGDSGVYARVTEAFELIEELRDTLKPKSIQFNVFGFSRGAFYARYFCAMAPNPDLTSKPARQSGRNLLDLASSKIDTNFVGIFDTVSSHGLNHYNDVEPFQLDIGKAQKIRKIVHLTAQNDYRNHFPLTRIRNNDVAFECSLVGAHSDIGGAYEKDWEEKQYLSNYDATESRSEVRISGEIDWQWFRDMGYYSETATNFVPHKPATGLSRVFSDKLTEKTGPVSSKQGIYGNFIVKERSQTEMLPSSSDEKIYYSTVSINRKFSSNSYQFIPLEIMRDITEKEAHLIFEGKGKNILEGDIKSVIAADGVLKKYRDYAHQYVMKNYETNQTHFKVDVTKALPTKEQQQQLYHNYIHNSLDVNTIANGSDHRNKAKDSRYGSGNPNPQRILINL